MSKKSNNLLEDIISYFAINISLPDNLNVAKLVYMTEAYFIGLAGKPISDFTYTATDDGMLSKDTIEKYYQFLANPTDKITIQSGCFTCSSLNPPIFKNKKLAEALAYSAAQYKLFGDAIITKDSVYDEISSKTQKHLDISSPDLIIALKSKKKVRKKKTK